MTQTIRAKVFHQPAKTEIYQSNNYDDFEMIIGNRDIDNLKIKRIEKDIEEGVDILYLVPIIVNKNPNKNGKLMIIDGQHRFLLSKKLCRPVYYVLSEIQLTLFEIARINSRTKNWKIVDYVNCYQRIGMKDYQTLIDFKKDSVLGWGPCVNFLMNGSPVSRTNVMGKLKRGEFKVYHLEKAKRIMELISKFDSYERCYQPAFIAAIISIEKAGIADMDHLVKRFERYHDRIKYVVKWRDYCNQLERIYNISLMKRKTIY